jgi:DNA polymerase family B
LEKVSNGRWAGILIDERKVMTLSRFQIIMWTVIILSAYFTMVNARIYASALGAPGDPLAIEIDWQLWAPLGISSTSLVGTPLIMDSRLSSDYQGGLVIEPKRGLYRNLKVVDVVSLYPSVAILHKISFDTVNCSCCIRREDAR